MSDLEYRILADSKELDNLLSDISSLKVGLIELEDVNRAINTSFRQVNTTIADTASGLASASANAKQLHTDLGYLIGDINKINIEGGAFGLDVSNRPLGTAFGDSLSGVGLGPELGSAYRPTSFPGHRTSGTESLLKHLGGPDYDALYPAFTGRNITVASLNNRARNAARVEPSIRDIEALGQGVGRTEIVEWLDKTHEAAERTNRSLRGTIGNDEGAGLRGLMTGGRRATLAIVELSRGMEDAAVTFGTGGIGGALRASINNFSQFAFVLHPIAGVVAGIAGALTAAAIPAIIEATSATDDLVASLRSLGDTLRDKEMFRIDLAGIADGSKTGLAALEARESRLEEQGQVIRDTTGRRLLGRQFGGASRYQGFELGVMNYFGSDYANQELQNLDKFGRIRGTDLEEFQTRVDRNIERGGGESSVAGFVEYLKQQGRITLDAEKTQELAKELSNVEEELIANFRDRQRVQAEILEYEKEQAKLAEQQSIQVQANLRQAETDTRQSAIKGLMDIIRGSVDRNSPDAAEDRAYAQRLDSIKNSLLGDSALGDAALQALEGDRNITLEERRRNKEFDEREAALLDTPFRSLAGQLTGLEELNRRITQSAAGVNKNDTAEQLKQLREERKKAHEEAQNKRDQANAVLREMLTVEQQKEVFGILAP